jgi:hypothetical protein
LLGQGPTRVAETGAAAGTSLTEYSNLQAPLLHALEPDAERGRGGIGLGDGKALSADEVAAGDSAIAIEVQVDADGVGAARGGIGAFERERDATGGQFRRPEGTDFGFGQ